MKEAVYVCISLPDVHVKHQLADLACAVLGSGEYISTCKGYWDRFFLNRTWPFETRCIDSHEKFSSQPKVFEGRSGCCCDVLLTTLAYPFVVSSGWNLLLFEAGHPWAERPGLSSIQAVLI